MHFAAVDLGSNSFRLHIGRYEEGSIRLIRSAREPIRLAAGLDAMDRLDDAAIARARACLEYFRSVLAEYPLDAIRVVATNTIRIATNREDFLPTLEQAIGCGIEVISGEEEGRLIYLGVAHTLAAPLERRLVIDIGGGSTEIILGHRQDILAVESFGIGTVAVCAQFFPEGRMTEEGFAAAILAARSRFEDAAHAFPPERWRYAYGSSGTMRALAEVLNRKGRVRGVLTLAALLELRDACVAAGQMDRLEWGSVRAERVPMVVAGLAILIGSMHELRIDTLRVLEAGLRMGVMWDLFLRSHQQDRREHAVRQAMRSFAVDADRAQHIQHVACALLVQLKPDTPNCLRFLDWAALLHEIGMLVSHTGYHRHGAYLIEHADLAGFSGKEQRWLARLVLAQKGQLRKVQEALQEADFLRAVLALRLALALAHAHVEFARDDLQLRYRQRIELDLASGWLDQHPTFALWLTREMQIWGEVGVEWQLRAA